MKTVFDYTNVCWHCGKNVYQAEQFRMCPDVICNTKYCSDCWDKTYTITDKSTKGKSVPDLSMAKFLKCYMCKKTQFKDFTGMTKIITLCLRVNNTEQFIIVCSN